MISESGGRTAVTDNPVSEDPSLPIDATSGKSPEHSGSYNTPATSALHSMWNNSAAAAASFIAPQQQHSPLQRQSTTASMDRYSPLPPIPTTITHQMNNSVAFGYPPHNATPKDILSTESRSQNQRQPSSPDHHAVLPHFDKALSSADSFMSSLGFSSVSAAAAYSAVAASTAAAGGRKLPPPEGNNSNSGNSLDNGSSVTAAAVPPAGGPSIPQSSDRSSYFPPAPPTSAAHHPAADNLLPGMPELMSHSHPPTQSTHALPPSQASSSAHTTAPSAASVQSSTPYPYFTSPNSDLSSPFYGSGSNCGSTGPHLSPKQYAQRRPKGGRSQGKTRKNKTN